VPSLRKADGFWKSILSTHSLGSFEEGFLERTTMRPRRRHSRAGIRCSKRFGMWGLKPCGPVRRMLSPTIRRASGGSGWVTRLRLDCRFPGWRIMTCVCAGAPSSRRLSARGRTASLPGCHPADALSTFRAYAFQWPVGVMEYYRITGDLLPSAGAAGSRRPQHVRPFARSDTRMGSITSPGGILWIGDMSAGNGPVDTVCNLHRPLGRSGKMVRWAHAIGKAQSPFSGGGKRTGRPVEKVHFSQTRCSGVRRPRLTTPPRSP